MNIKHLTLVIAMVLTAMAATAQDATILRRYAQKGDAQAMYDLAELYMDGTGGVEEDMEQAFAWVMKAAKKKMPQAQALVAWHYFYGEGVPVDYQKAYEYAQKAAKQDYAKAYHMLAKMYRKGLYVQKDTQLYLSMLNTAATLGSSLSQYELGCIYLDGDYDVPVDTGKAMALLTSAAEQGDGDAMVRIGRYLIVAQEQVTDDNKATAFNYFRRAVARNTAAAYYPYAHCCFHGIGCEVDRNDAFVHYIKAAQTDDDRAYVMLGHCYNYGFGVKADADAAFAWYKKAEEAGDSEAYFELAIMYEHGKGVEQDHDLAYKYYSLAAEEGGNSSGLGYCYEYGIGVEKDLRTAVRYYKTAADNENKYYAQHRLFVLYRIGASEVEITPEQAITYLRKAADQGYSFAMYHLAVEYANGDMIERDDNMAFRYMEESSKRGYSMADAHLGIIYYRGEAPCEQDFDKAFFYLTRALNDVLELTIGMYADVCRCLGACYRFGRGTDVDHSRASLYTERAAKFGDEDSLNALQIYYK